MKDDVALRIRECLNDAKNKKIVNDIVLKMGRVLEKKRALQSEQPVLVFENRIWIGNYSYANNREFLQINEIKSVISCLEMSLSLYLPDITYQRFDLKDSVDERFEETVRKFIDFVDKQQRAIYIHCFSGRSRSPALLLAYIMYRQGKTYDEAIENLRKIYPIATPNTHFQSVLRKMVFKQVETKNLLDENVEQIPSSPRKQIDQIAVQSPNKKEINLLQMRQKENLEEKLQLNLLEQTVPSIVEQISLINIDTTPQNSINIFQMQKQEDKPKVNNNVQLLDFKQQTEPIPKQIQTQQLVQNQIEKIETVQDNLIDLDTKPKTQTISEQPQKPNEIISDVKTESVNLLQELIPQVKVEKEQSFADNTDFTQKKVKKHKKKR